MSPRSRGRRRLRARARTGRVLGTMFQVQVASLALEHWDRLEESEQRRFRELAGRARTPSDELSKPERKELKQLWSKLDGRGLIAGARRLATGRAEAPDG